MRWLVLALMIAVTSCGSSSRAPATVRGRVLFQGQPLAGGTVVFTPHPDRGPAAKPASAIIDGEGLFRLSLDSQPYITPGWYRVSLADPGTTHTWAIFPAALRRPDRSGLEREVLAGQEHVCEFHIETR